MVERVAAAMMALRIMVLTFRSLFALVGKDSSIANTKA
jgi:hypothetical protein